MSTQQPDIRSIPLAALVFSQTTVQAERRSHFDKAALKELGETIKSAGRPEQLITVRPVRMIRTEGLNGIDVLGKTYFSPDEAEKAAEGRFEVADGERRCIAAEMVGLSEILCEVRDLTDEQILDIQIVTGLQKEGLHEMVEAEGYETLSRRGMSADEIADKVGKSKATVYARMKLLALCPEGRKAFYAGKLTASTALLLARIPVEDLQKKALKEITTPQRTYDGPGDPMSVRAAAKHIHDTYMLRLSSAGFKTEDATLVPSAGPCGACPKRTGNQPELFQDVKGADVCTDPTCFNQKIKAHAERALAAATETGQKVLTGQEAKKVAKYGTDAHSLEGYVRLDARDYHGGTGKPKTYRQVLGKAYVPTLLQDPDTGKMIEVAPNKDVDKAHGNRDRTSNDRNANSYAAKQRAAEKKHRMEIAYRLALFKAIHDAGAGRKTLTRRELEAASDRLFERLDHESKKRLFAALGWEPKKSRYHNGVELDLPTPIEKMTDEQLVQLIRDCTLAYELQVWQHSGESRAKMLEAAAVALDVDAKRIRRELEAAAKAKADKGKKSAPAKASKKKAAKKK